MKFLRKPLAILSGVVLLAGLVLTVVLALLPHGGTYKGTFKVGNAEMEQRFEFRDDKLHIINVVGGKDVEVEEDGLDYYIKGGKLYVGINKEAYDSQLEEANKLSGEAKEAALKALDAIAMYKVNAFRISANIDAEDEETLANMKDQYGVESPVWTCSVNNALLYVGIALMAVGVVGAVVACVFIMQDKKGSKKTTTTTEANA